ncbi:MAG TPA: FecR domain-containing protein [Sulfuricella sp.]|nr:FecR domain-containing protein [Sulfuricella sp.]
MAAIDNFGSQQDAAASERAAYWFARLRADDCSEGERLSFEAWLSESDVHRREYDRLRLMWEELDGLKGQFQSVGVASRPRAASRPLRGFSSFGWPQLSAAAALLIAVGIGWFGIDGAAMQSYGTAKGEQRGITLPDGSVAQLGTDTLLTVEMSAKLRKVRLEKGEALFTVAHEERPFEVGAGNGVIRDIGTQFDVRRDDRRVAVAVLNGAVEVRLGEGKVGSDAGTTLALSKGQQAFYSENGLSTVSPADEKTVTAWRNGKLVFDGTPLAEVVRELERYHDRRIVIADPSLGTLKVSGVFNAGDLDGLLLALQQVLPLQAERTGSTITLSRPVAATSPRLLQTF